jgi:hypothetical protein
MGRNTVRDWEHSVCIAMPKIVGGENNTEGHCACIAFTDLLKRVGRKIILRGIGSTQDIKESGR